MMAMRSLRVTSRSTPRSTSTGAGPWYVFVRLRHASTASRIPSFIPKGFGGVDLGGAPARVERGEKGEGERDQGDGAHVVVVHFGGEVADQIDILRHDVEAEEILDRRHHRLDVEREQHPAYRA